MFGVVTSIGACGWLDVEDGVDVHKLRAQLKYAPTFGCAKSSGHGCGATSVTGRTILFPPVWGAFAPEARSNSTDGSMTASRESSVVLMTMKEIGQLKSSCLPGVKVSPLSRIIATFARKFLASVSHGRMQE